MPSNLINKDAREGKGSKKSLERKWDRAKDAAGKKDGEQNYALTTYIYEKMRDSKKKSKASILDKVKLNAAFRLLSNFSNDD